MNDLPTLKRALDAPPGFTPRDLDVDGIVRTGGRLRRRRRLAVGSASAVAVAAVLVGGSQLVPGRQTPTPPAAAPAASSPALSSSTAPSPAVSSSAASSSGEPSGPLGAVIDTGLKTTGGVWVLYGVTVTGMPDIPFGVMLGVRGPGGHITPSVEINETVGSALAAGFHEGEGSQNIDGRNTLTFGYYVGKPYRIGAKVHGKTVSAHFKAWSQNSSVTVFWFSTADAGPGQAVTGLAAYDRQGGKLPAGNPRFGLG